MGLHVSRVFGHTKRRRIVSLVMILALVFGIITPVLLSQQKASAWWNGSWGYRRKITLSNNAAGAINLVDFPLRVSLTTGNFTYANAQGDGDDIRFVDADDTTLLSYEEERWTSGGTSEFWVRVPQINTGTADFIYVYYGNGVIGDGQNVTGTWSSDYKTVHHFSGTSSPQQDSTSNNLDTALDIPSVRGSATGKIAGANSHVSSTGSDAVSIPDAAVLDLASTYTVEAWIRPTSTPGSGTFTTVFSKGSFNDDKNYELQLTNTDELRGRYHNSAGSVTTVTGSTCNCITAGTFHKVVMTFNLANTLLNVYVNGVQRYTIPLASNTPNVNTAPLYVGLSASDELFDGIIDEVRVSSGTVTQNAEYIEAIYNSENNTMASFGAQETPPVPPSAPVLTDLTTNVSLTPTFQLRAADSVSPNYLRYKIDVCDVSDCSNIVRTIDQTSSQTGWTGQDSQAGTAYVASATLASSTLASHTYQSSPAPLDPGTTYWWRGYAIDPADSNSWSAASAIDSFTTLAPPSAPTLIEPASGAASVSVLPQFRLWTTDNESDNVRYSIDVCSTSNCSSVVRTINQTSSQTGWTSQNASSGTAYTTSTILSGSQQAIHAYQSPALTANTQYWWRASAIDPSGSNSFGPVSAINTFTTGVVPSSMTELTGGTTISGGSRFGQ